MTAARYTAVDPAAVDAVAVVMRQVAEGSLTGATLAARAAQRCREVFAVVDGPTDPLFPVHVEICLAVLGFTGSIPASVLAQFLAVARHAENPGLVTIDPPDAGSSRYGPSGADSGDVGDVYGAGVNPVAPQLDTVDTAIQDDPFAGVPRDVLAEAEGAALGVIDRWRKDQPT